MPNASVTATTLYEVRPQKETLCSEEPSMNKHSVTGRSSLKASFPGILYYKKTLFQFVPQTPEQVEVLTQFHENHPNPFAYYNLTLDLVAKASPCPWAIAVAAKLIKGFDELLLCVQVNLWVPHIAQTLLLRANNTFSLLIYQIQFLFLSHITVHHCDINIIILPLSCPTR